MVPEAFVILERLPLTSSGKLDRRSLPDPGIGAYTSREHEAPQGSIEEGIARVWQELLHVERVGRHDRFFDLGGHSLLAMQAISRLRDVLYIELPLSAMFEAPTVEQLAKHIDRTMAQAVSPDEEQDVDDLPEHVLLERIAELERQLGYAEDSGGR
jgi:syringomycin synthetase protein SyrE